MDSMIALAGILFILSMINERIANFIKLQYSSRRFLFIKLGNLREKKTDGEEDDRDKRIILLNIVIGTIVSLLLRADLICIVTHFSMPSKGIGWDTLDGNTYWWLTLLPGCILTGCFLSLGSKFWHDLLDLLLYTKNIKAQLAQPVNGSTGANIAAGIAEKEMHAIEVAADAYKKEIIHVENVTAVALNTDTQTPYVEVFVNNYFSNQTLIPKKVFYIGQNNRPKSIDVKIVTGFHPAVHSDLWPADNILNQNPYPGNRGSMGGKVYDNDTNEEYFLSCYHVVKSPANNWDSTPNDNNNVFEFTTNSLCGQIVKAIRDNEVDGAIMRAENGFAIKGDINGIGAPVLTRDLTTEDKRLKTNVKMFGGISQELKVGYVSDVEVPADLSYYKDHTAETELHRLNKLIFITSIDDEPFSLPGDSGSLVIDEYNYVIGLLVGGHGRRSFVIPINTVLKSLNIKMKIK